VRAVNRRFSGRLDAQKTWAEVLARLNLTPFEFNKLKLGFLKGDLELPPQAFLSF
jgi:hypothetical protein